MLNFRVIIIMRKKTMRFCDCLYYRHHEGKSAIEILIILITTLDCRTYNTLYVQLNLSFWFKNLLLFFFTDLKINQVKDCLKLAV